MLFLLIFYAPALIFKLDKNIANTSLKEKKINRFLYMTLK